MCRAPVSTDSGQVDLCLQIPSDPRDGTASRLPDDAASGRIAESQNESSQRRNSAGK